MGYLLSYSKWTKINEFLDFPNLPHHEERLVNRFIRKIKNDDAMSDLIDRRTELTNVDSSELDKLSQNLNINRSDLDDWIAGRKDTDSFIERIAQNLVKQGTSRAERKQVTQSTEPVSQLADVASGKNFLKLGSSGEDVKIIQQKLFDLGFTDAEPTGNFDESTENAVKEFQKSKQIGTDGIVGPITYAQLYGIKLAPKVDLSSSNYENIVKSVIDTLEGGYYHPTMRQKDPSKFPGYERSGETMFGLDRFAGHNIYYSTPRIGKNPMDDLQYIESGKYEYKTDAAKQFWGIIDSANAKENWSWNYMGGQYKDQLEQLAGEIMKPEFESLFGQYLSTQAQEIVKNDPMLMFHMVYAAWNGAGWFKKFATDLSQAVANGTTDPAVLRQIAIDSRTKEGLQKGTSPVKLIAQSGNKIEKMFGIA